MRVGHYRAAHTGGREQAKTEAENTLILYLQKFHWDWPLSREPQPGEVLPLDKDLSEAEEEHKALHVERLHGSIEQWLKTRIELAKPKKNMLRQVLASIDVPSTENQALTTSGEAATSDKQTLQKDKKSRINQGEENKKVDTTHVLLACMAGIDLQGNLHRPTDAQYWSKNSFRTVCDNFDAHFEDSGLSGKHQVSEADVFAREQFEELSESEQAIWKKKNRESHEKLLSSIFEQTLSLLEPDDCAA